MKIGKRRNRAGDKYYYHIELGRGKGQRIALDIFTYVKPKSQLEKNHNKETQDQLKLKLSNAIIEKQSIGTAYIPQHKFMPNFLDYYQRYVEKNAIETNRALENSFTQFKLFIKKPIVTPIEITEELCKKFRKFLKEKYNGETPMGYFARFKQCVTAAKKDKYFQENPVEDVAAQPSPSIKMKEIVEKENYLTLLDTPCWNEEVKFAFIFSLYTGLRWVDINAMNWSDITGTVMVKRLVQSKTGVPVAITLHPIAQQVILIQQEKADAIKNTSNKVFHIPTREQCNKVILDWVRRAGIGNYYTFSCARLSFSVLLQDELVDDATVASLLGHKTTKQVNRTYKRHRPKNQMDTIRKLPMPDKLPEFLRSSL